MKRGSRRANGGRGQATVEFAISSIVLLLLACGLFDLSRVFYFQVNLLGSAREGARHGAWFDTPNRQNPYLDDADILSAVSQNLSGAGLAAVTTNSSTNLNGCPTPTDGNSYTNPPYPGTLYPTTTNTAVVYLCYTPPATAYTGCNVGSTPVGTLTAHPTTDCWRLGDLNVIVLMGYGLVTPLAGFLGQNGLQVASNSHMEIQGKP